MDRYLYQFPILKVVIWQDHLYNWLSWIHRPQCQYYPLTYLYQNLVWTHLWTHLIRVIRRPVYIWFRASLMAWHRDCLETYIQSCWKYSSISWGVLVLIGFRGDTINVICISEGVSQAPPVYIPITMTSKWARWRLKSPASRMFTHPFIQGADQRKHQSYSVTRKMFPFDDVIIMYGISRRFSLAAPAIKSYRRHRTKSSNTFVDTNVSNTIMWMFVLMCVWHYADVIMTTLASQITSLTVVYSNVYSGADQSKHQSSASLAFVWGIHRGPVNSPHKWPVTRKMFPFDDVIMNTFFCMVLIALLNCAVIETWHLKNNLCELFWWNSELLNITAKVW